MVIISVGLCCPPEGGAQREEEEEVGGRKKVGSTGTPTPGVDAP